MNVAQMQRTGCDPRQPAPEAGLLQSPASLLAAESVALTARHPPHGSLEK